MKFTLTVASSLCLLFTLLHQHALGQQTQLEMRQKFNASDFVYNLDSASAVLTNGGGSIRPLLVDQMPALAGQKISMVLFELLPCGIIIPEVHPRATEMIYVIQGANLQVGFAEENGGRFLINVLQQGQVTFFPQGLIHFQQNLGCSKVKYIAGLNNEDPGVLSMSTQTFGLPAYALESTFNQTLAEIQAIKAGLPPGPAAGYGNCLATCLKSRK